MELDDFKKSWQLEQNRQTTTQDIMELMHQKSRGPIASLKTAFRKQMAAVAALMAVVGATQAKNVDTVSSNLLFWTYILFCIGLIGTFFFNYRLTQKMERMDSQVKVALEQHVMLLEQRLKWSAMGARVVIIFFIILLEVIPHFQHLRMLGTWHALPPVVRFSSYAAYLVFQYFLSRAVTQKRFGKHLDRLKQLLGEVR